MFNLEFKQFEEAIVDYDLLLLDLWGVVIEGGKTYEGVAEVINRISKTKKILFLSNAPRPNYIIAKNLLNWGIKEVSPKKVVTSGDVTRMWINENFVSKNQTPRICHIGQDRNDQILESIKYIDADVNDADILLITAYRDEDENVDQFNDVLAFAGKNKKLVTLCANPDVIVPNLEKKRFCAGYFASIVEQNGGNVIYTGKPKVEIYNHIFKLYPNLQKDKILMVGDTFETDMLGARDSGIRSALVLTGNSQKIHGHHKNIESKLSAIHNHAKQENIFPSFVTSIV